jgi:hypothetical protein
MNNPVGAHEVRKCIKMRTSVIVKNLGVDVAMNNKKGDEEKTGSTHQEFPANVSGKGSFPIHKSVDGVIKTAQR